MKYSEQDVRDLFNRLETDRGKYYPEDAADMLPLEEWLDNNLNHPIATTELDDLAIELNNIQSICTGVFQNLYNLTVELIVKEDEHMFVTATIGDLFGLSKTTMSKDNLVGYIHHFPDGKTLSEMLEDPIEFSQWFTEKIMQS